MQSDKKMKLTAGRTMSNTWFMIKIIFQASPLYGIMLILEKMRHNGLIFVEHTVGIGFVLEAAEFGKPFREVVSFMLFMFALLAFSGLYSAVFNSVVAQICMPKIERKLKFLLYGKAGSLDIACYDDPEYYNEFVMAVSEAKNSIDRAVNLIGMLVSGLVIFFSYGTYFLMKDPISVTFVIVSFVASFFVYNVANKIRFRLKLETNPLNKKRQYVHRTFYLSAYAKELRLNRRLSRRLYQDFEETNKSIYNCEKKVSKKLWGLNFLTNYLFSDFIFDGIYLGYLVFQAAVRKVLSLSGLVVMYNSIGSLRNGMRILSELPPTAVEMALYVEKIRMFLAYETKVVSEENLPVPDTVKEIRFENVSFAYDEAAGDSIHHVSFTIAPQEKIALVGYNGAGKTTMIKLLMRLYDPTEGRILLDGVDIRRYDLEQYRSRIGTVFQDYQVYAATVAENVVMDEVPPQTDVTLALRQSGFSARLANMERGVDTGLTREFDDSGTNLSGGESQKLAVARVFYKDCSLIILDEPSSALDPIAEYQLNVSMARASVQKSVIFISHRLSTTRHADRILMLEKGRVIESGTHEVLLEKNGKYAEMWHAQASKYV